MNDDKKLKEKTESEGYDYTGFTQNETYVNAVEALIFAAGKEISKDDILKKITVMSKKELDLAIETLKEKYSKSSGVILLVFNNKLQFVSNPKYAEIVLDVLTPIREKELSRTLIEVLAIIAFKQPLTKLDIEEIRGVSSEYAVAMLQKASLIDVIGRKNTVGKPLLYGTTDNFLKKFRLSGLSELPGKEQLMERIKVLDEQYNEFGEGLYHDRHIAEDVAADIEKEAVSREVDSFDELRILEDDVPEFLKGETINIVE